MKNSGVGESVGSDGLLTPGAGSSHSATRPVSFLCTFGNTVHPEGASGSQEVAELRFWAVSFSLESLVVLLSQKENLQHYLPWRLDWGLSHFLLHLLRGLCSLSGSILRLKGTLQCSTSACTGSS